MQTQAPVTRDLAEWIVALKDDDIPDAVRAETNARSVVEQLRAAAAQAPVETELVRYAEADHGFNRDIGHAYDPEAATDARTRVLEMFEARLVT